jgi:hypothetical protein
MLSEYLQYSGLLDKSEIEETLESFRMHCALNESDSRRELNKLIDELRSISTRDSFELLVEIYDDVYTLQGVTREEIEVLMSSLDAHDDDDPLDVELVITKNLVGSFLSVYVYDAFASFLINRHLSQILLAINAVFDGDLRFEVQGSFPESFSSGISFLGVGGEAKELSVLSAKNRGSKISLLTDNVSSLAYGSLLLPSDFVFDSPVNNKENGLNERFNEIAAALSLKYLSNSFEVLQENNVSYRITGYRLISEESVSIKEINQSREFLYKIYDWVYCGGGGVDKLGLARNVISLSSDEKLIVDKTAWEAIHANYQIYLKGNIQSYLDVKGKVGASVLEFSNSTYTIADELLLSFKNNIFAVFSFLMIAILTNGIKQASIGKMFSWDYFSIVFIISIVSLSWYKFVKKDVDERFKSAGKTVKETLVSNYSKIIRESEIISVFDDGTKSSNEFLKERMVEYSKWWKGFLFLFVILYFSATVLHQHVIPCFNYSANHKQLDISKIDLETFKTNAVVKRGDAEKPSLDEEGFGERIRVEDKKLRITDLKLEE